MKEIYSDAFSEVDAILNIMPSNLFNKIPLNFRQIISEYKNDSYNPQIKEPVEDYELKDETKIILSIIYRDFLCSNEEKERLKARDSQKLKEEEEQLREKYNPDNIFKDKKTNSIESVEESVAMIEYKESFLTRLLNKIKNIFRKG